MTNCRPHSGGWQVYTRVKGRFVSVLLPAQPTALEVREWVRQQHVAGKSPDLMLPAEQRERTFAEDVTDYLAAVATMPTIRWRTEDMARWVAVFGTRPRQAITAVEIRQQLEAWRKDYAANTVNHRRTAMLHFFSVTNGKAGANPVRDVPRYRDDSQDAPPKAIPLSAVKALLARMPDSATKARLSLMAWTSWPQAQIARLEPGDVDWKGKRVYVRPRRKGKGVGGRWVTVLPQAWTALRAMRRWDAWGAFSTSSARKSLRLAATHLRASKTTPKAVKAAVEDVTPYDLRHSLLTLIAAVTKDDRAVAAVALHADLRQAMRYSKAATDPRVTAALSQMQKHLGR